MGVRNKPRDPQAVDFQQGRQDHSVRAKTFSSTNGAGTTGYAHAKEWDSTSHCIQKLTQNGLTVEMKMGVAAVEIRMVVPQKQTNIELPSDPLLSISKRN